MGTIFQRRIIRGTTRGGLEATIYTRRVRCTTSTYSKETCSLNYEGRALFNIRN